MLCSSCSPHDVVVIIVANFHSCALQLMDNNLILPGGAIIVDNTLMKVGRTDVLHDVVSTAEPSGHHCGDAS